MKVYDKEIYKKQESLSMTVIVIIAFLLGFFTGYLTNSFTKNETGNMQNSNNVNTIIKNV